MATKKATNTTKTAKAPAWNYSYNNQALVNAVKNAQTAYNNATRQMTDVNEYFNQLMSQPKFTYDMNNDQLFQMYKRQYAQQGNAAMQNAMGIAAAANGGYNSSNAQTAAQTIYGNYMDALSEKAAQTYQNAYDRYNTEFARNQSLLDARMGIAQANMTNAQNRLVNAQNALNDDKTYRLNQYTNQMNYNLTKKQYNG